MSWQEPLELDQYQTLSARTDKSVSRETSGLHFLLLGLFGEVGSLLSELKKKQRDKTAYLGVAPLVRTEISSG
jgi:hypothetical protein